MREEVGIYQIQGAEYPSEKTRFRPGKIYKELENLPIAECADAPNHVYDGVRNALLLLEYDREHIGTGKWNPLRGLVSPGQCVVLKPNLVMHKNRNVGGGRACLYTHPSIVAAVLDYTILAMTDEHGRFSGKIIVGDAPMQSCDFGTLLKESGYEALICYYQEKGYAVSLMDFRNVKTKDSGWARKKQERDRDSGIVVSLGRKSNFAGLGAERMKRLRITCYDPAILKRHHNMHIHEYRVAEEILKADAIINMPKPKTHRKAGVTIAMKNFVGISSNKEYLPHHTVGSKQSGHGDEYLHTNWFFQLEGIWGDWMNMAMQREHYILAGLLRVFAGVFYVVGKKTAKEPYREGSWYGNDTIWRTIYDLNNIVLFCDKKGRMKSQVQRKVLHIADMVIAGEGDGPLAPSPKECGVIAIGENPALFDECVCSLMGFYGDQIPSVAHLRDAGRLFFKAGQAKLVSNKPEWNTGKGLIAYEDSLKFIPNPGWRDRWPKSPV